MLCLAFMKNTFVFWTDRYLCKFYKNELSNGITWTKIKVSNFIPSNLFLLLRIFNQCKVDFRELRRRRNSPGIRNRLESAILVSGAFSLRLPQTSPRELDITPIGGDKGKKKRKPEIYACYWLEN